MFLKSYALSSKSDVFWLVCLLFADASRLNLWNVVWTPPRLFLFLRSIKNVLLEVREHH